MLSVIKKGYGGDNAAENSHDEANAPEPLAAWAQAMKHDKPACDEKYNSAELRHWTVQN